MCIIDCLSTIVFILPLHLDYTKVIILILWWRNFQLEYWRTFQLVSTIHEKVAIVASRMGNGLSIGKFVDNILRDHFREYGQQYMEQIENAQKVRL